jgi:hypothetical protein
MTRHDPATMPPTHLHLPAPAPAEPADLDLRIEQLELRLVAREAWLRSSAQALGERTHQGLAPSSWLLPALGVGTVLLLVWRRRPRRNPAPPVGAASAAVGAILSIAWRLLWRRLS